MSAAILSLEGTVIGELLFLIVYLITLLFGYLVKLGSYFQFNMTEVEGGVICEGVLSLLYLPVIYFIVAAVIVLFDSSVYVFFKVGPTDYRHYVST